MRLNEELLIALNKEQVRVLFTTNESDCIYAYIYTGEGEIEEDDDPDKLYGYQHIGEVEVNEEDNTLRTVKVDELYQRQGIGIKLIELAIEYLDLCEISCAHENRGTEYALTQAGERLIASCIRKGIITRSMCTFKNQTASMRLR